MAVTRQLHNQIENCFLLHIPVECRKDLSIQHHTNNPRSYSYPMVWCKRRLLFPLITSQEDRNRDHCNHQDIFVADMPYHRNRHSTHTHHFRGYSSPYLHTQPKDVDHFDQQHRDKSMQCLYNIYTIKNTLHKLPQVCMHHVSLLGTNPQRTISTGPFFFPIQTHKALTLSRYCTTYTMATAHILTQAFSSVSPSSVYPSIVFLD